MSTTGSSYGKLPADQELGEHHHGAESELWYIPRLTEQRHENRPFAIKIDNQGLREGYKRRTWTNDGAASAGPKSLAKKTEETTLSDNGSGPENVTQGDNSKAASTGTSSINIFSNSIDMEAASDTIMFDKD